MSDTWNFNKGFDGLKKDNIGNEIFFKECLLDMNYSEVIIDEDDKVHGYLFGVTGRKSVNPLMTGIRTFAFLMWGFYHYLVGSFGQRKTAWLRLKETIELTEALEEQRRNSDGYVNLFFVGSSLRGQGWGKKLMTNYQERCLEVGVKRLYLWTDKGCNYKFYDHNGFTRIIEISSPGLAEYGYEPNGFAYTKLL